MTTHEEKSDHSSPPVTHGCCGNSEGKIHGKETFGIELSPPKTPVNQEVDPEDRKSEKEPAHSGRTQSTTNTQ